MRPHGGFVSVAAFSGRLINRRRKRLHYYTKMPVGMFVFQRGFHRAASLMPHHQYEGDVEVLGGVFHACQRGFVNNYTRGPYHEKIADALIENEFRTDTGIGACDDSGDRMLSAQSLGAARRRLVRMRAVTGGKPRVAPA